MTTDPNDYRLPTNIRPTHYDLTFKTDLEGLKFYGYAIIDLDVLADSDSIIFNAVEIEFTDALVFDPSSGRSYNQIARSDDAKQERVALKFPETFKKGSKVQLSVSWKGELTDSMNGYYRSSFEKDGKKIYYALTQLEAVAARRAFPVWDEPLLKARYTITLISRSETISLSNMPATSEVPYSGSRDVHPVGVRKLVSMYPHADPSKAANEWKVTTFERSPLMSSYLVAFANGDFNYLEDSYISRRSGISRKLRLYTTPDLIHQAQFALDLMRESLPIYEEIFDVEYALPKLDTLVSADFDAGAMENWGLIMGRASSFLFDPKKSSLSAKKRVAVVQLHECAHMWFGDITTMKWWDALWLNEGFATLMGQVVIMNKLFPEWKAHSSFIIAGLEKAFKLDSMRSSHPIMAPLPDPKQIDQIFDPLSYEKSASVLRMLSEFVGEKKFLEGVSIYLKKNLYGNTEPIDLWNGISESTGIDVAKMMDPWVNKIGFPVVTVNEEGHGKIHVRQDRFLASGDPTEDENETIWTVPLSILSTDASGKVSIDRSVVLQDREVTIPIDVDKPWKLNAGTIGTFRVAYESERLKQLGVWASQEGSAFSLEDRMGLVSDATFVAQAGMHQTSAALDLIKAFHNEQENLMWSAMSASLSSIEHLLWEQPAELRQRWCDFINYLFFPIVKKLGYEYKRDDSADVRELRTLAITSCAQAGEPTVVKELITRFDKFVETKDATRVPPDLEAVIFSTAVEHGDQKEFGSVKLIWKEPPTPSTKNAAAGALTQVKTDKLAKQALDWFTDEVDLQDWHGTADGFSKNTFTRRKVAQYFYDNYDFIVKRYEGNFSIKDTVQNIFRTFTTEKDANDIEAFFEGKDNSKYELALKQAIENVRVQAKWLDRSQSDIEAWLAKFSREAATA
ncbi:leucyl aminopeptidase [Clavulina sp. PMI_390]|nr:leucyl aminopeptidase [Clavulina sp. PMI_390]